MTPPAQEITWLGAGWLAKQPAETAWRALAASVGIGLVIVVVSYCFTLVALASPGAWRHPSALLRLVMWLALLLLLAAPTRIERTYDHPTANVRPLAVLVDRSDSMTVVDNRQQRRLDEALVKWHRLEPAARRAFGTVKAFAFAQGMAPVASPGDAARLARADAPISSPRCKARSPRPRPAAGAAS